MIIILVWTSLFDLGGVDYTSGPYSVTFTAGTTTASFDVVIIDNDAYRGNVYFYIAIDALSLPSNVVAGNQSSVIIIDDDSK